MKHGKELTRGKTFILGGVCSGLAKYYGVKKGGLQTCFVIGSFLYGSTILLYLALWILIPKNV